MNRLRKFDNLQNGTRFSAVEGNTVYIYERVPKRTFFRKKKEENIIVAFFVAVKASDTSIKEWLESFNFEVSDED